MSRRFLVYLGEVYFPEPTPGGENGGGTISGSYILADWIEPLFLSETSQGEFGELRCIAHKHPEDVDDEITLGQSIRVMDNGLNDADVGDPSPVFEGVIVKTHYNINGENEQSDIVAYNNADFLLSRMSIHGQYRRTYEQESDLFSTGDLSPKAVSGLDQLYDIDTPCVFNPEGLYNMSQDAYTIEGVNSGTGGDESCPWLETGTHIFEVPGRYQYTSGATYTSALLQAQPWHLSNAIQYILSTSQSKWAIDPASWSVSSLEAVFCNHGDPIISNENMEGKTVQQALRELLEKYNYGFTVSPIPSGNPALQTLTFFYKGNGTEAPEIALSDRNTNAVNSTANLISADICRDATPIVNAVVSYGDQVFFTTMAHTNPPSVGMGQPPALKLEKGWRSEDLIWAFDSLGKINVWDIEFRKQYVNAVDLISKLPDGNGGFRYPYGVGRHWVVNLGEVPDATLMDLTPALNNNANGVNSIDPRRFEKPKVFSRNTAGGHLNQEDIQVEMSFDSGTHWAVVDESWFKAETDSLAITFSEPHLERLGLKFINASFPAGVTYWDALYAGTLQIRVLCGVKSDERLKEFVDNDGSAFPLSVQRIHNNPGYRKYKYSPLINDSAYYTSYAPVNDAVDDGDALDLVNQQFLECTNRQMVSGSLRLVLGDFRDYHPGQIVSNITTRFHFSFPPTIMRVIYDLPNQHVQLVLDNRFTKTVIQNKHMSDATRREHNVGIENPREMQGNKVPFIPGDQKSWMRSILNGLSEGSD